MTTPRLMHVAALGVFGFLLVVSASRDHVKEGERVRRSTEIWRVSHVADTNDDDEILRPFEPLHRQWGDDSLFASTKHSSSPTLSVHYHKGTYSGSDHYKGAGFYSTPHELPDGTDNIILMYDVYFENFGFGAMGKLPGLFGGETGDGAYACSGGHNPPTCFSLRLMWRRNGEGELYAYVPSSSSHTGRSDIVANGKYGLSIGRGHVSFKNNAWQTVLVQAHLNTPGHADGYVKFCNTVRGESQHCYTARNLVMRNNPHYHLRGLFFSTFFGGSDPDRDRAPNDCYTYFTNFRLKVPSSPVG